MNNYRVSFYKDLLNSEAHNFKCLQHQIDIPSDGPSQALVLAEQLVGNTPLDIDRVEVTHLADGHRRLEHPSVRPVISCKQNPDAPAEGRRAALRKFPKEVRR